MSDIPTPTPAPDWEGVAEAWQQAALAWQKSSNTWEALYKALLAENERGRQ